MNFPGWLVTAMQRLPVTECEGCGYPILTADEQEGVGLCDCPAPVVTGYLPEVAVEGDGPSVAYAPALPKDQKIEADGKGGIVFYKRSRSTYRMVPVKRVAPWTEVTP